MQVILLGSVMVEEKEMQCYIFDDKFMAKKRELFKLMIVPWYDVGTCKGTCYYPCCEIHTYFFKESSKIIYEVG